ncbi:hypothetical protein T08_2685 [Trichinella sp. T8]|nr:hypothetical protein T08_2685 [Trichinella sp. T8]
MPSTLYKEPPSALHPGKIKWNAPPSALHPGKMKWNGYSV